MPSTTARPSVEYRLMRCAAARSIRTRTSWSSRSRWKSASARLAEPGQGRAISITMRTPGHDSQSWRWVFSTVKDCCGSRADVVDVPALRAHGPMSSALPCLRRSAARSRPAEPEFLHHFQLRRVRQGVHRSRPPRAQAFARVANGLIVREPLPARIARASSGLRRRALPETGGMHAVGLFSADRRVHRQPRRRGPPQCHGQGRWRGRARESCR